MSSSRKRTIKEIDQKEIHVNLKQRSSSKKSGKKETTKKQPVSSGKKNNLEVLKASKDYFKIFRDDKNWREIQTRQFYTLIEDIALIYYFGQDEKHQSLTQSFFVQLLKKDPRIQRSSESLRDRYKKYLCHLTKENFMQIVSYLIDNEKDFEKGIYGYLIFHKQDGVQTMKEVSKKQINFEEKNERKPMKINIKDIPEVEWALRDNHNERMRVRPIQLKKEVDLSVKIVKEKDQDERVVKRKFKFPSLDLLSKCQVFQETFAFEKQDVIFLLNAFSGDWEEILKYAIGERYSVPNWTKENDKVISTYSNKKPNAQFQKLIEERGEEQIRKRIKFNNLNINF